MIFAIISAILLFLFLVYIFFLARPLSKNPQNPDVLCEYAHRGLYGGSIPENSLAAFERAIERNVGIELDVQFSSDGEVFVFHDSDLKRMTGVSGPLCKMTSHQIEELRLSETDMHIPKLSEVLSLVNGKVPILVELKGENLDTSLCDKIAPILKEYSGDYIVESFNPFLIRKIKKLIPDAFAGQLYTNVCKEQKKYNPITFMLTIMAFNFVSRPAFIAYNKEYGRSFPVRLTTEFFHAHKFVWTVKGEEELQFARSLKEHAIFEEVFDTKKTELSSSAYFAGGCFWCITPDFKEKNGVVAVTAGFSGGEEKDPSYLDVKHQKTGHRETVKVDYDPDTVSFDELFDIFLLNVDPFDKDGQFIDRGHSYTLAVYYTSESEKHIAEKKITELETDSGKSVYISVEPFKTFYEAGQEHQDYYLKHPEEFACEIKNSGRKKKNLK